MKPKFLSTLVFLVFAFVQIHASSPVVNVFTSGTEGYNTFRIPAIIGLPNDDLLAFAEGRVNGSSDFGNVDIVMKRSSDRGKTWSKLSVVVDYEKFQAGNPAPVLDLLDPRFPKGRIFLFYNTGNNHEDQVRKGNGIREVWYKTSVDGGKTWSEPVNITLQVHKPNQPAFNPEYHFQEEWRSYANTPGHALQFSDLPHKGRIYVAANHSEGGPKKDRSDYFAHGFYTDDHGKTFHLSESVPVPGSNESTAAELSGGKLMLNARNQKGDVKARIVAISKNGGQSWDTVYFDRQLPDPVCEGSLLNIGQQSGKKILAFCNNADTLNRTGLTLRISFDEGKNWKLAFSVDQNTGKPKPDYTAYSDLVKLGRRTIGVVYEKNDYSEIAFKKLRR